MTIAVVFYLKLTKIEIPSFELEIESDEDEVFLSKSETISLVICREMT